jgi:hypothetical protein
VSCSAVTPPGGANQAIGIVGTFPGANGQVGNNDAEIAIAAPSAANLLHDASATLGLAPPAALTSTNVTHYTMGTTNTFGSQTASGVGTDGTGLPGTTQLVRDQLAFTGIYALLKVDLFNLLIIPDGTRAAAGNPNSLDPNVDPNSIYGAAITLCEQRRAMLLVDPPPPVRDVAAAVDWKTVQLALHSPNVAAYFPRLRLPDPANDYQLRSFAPSGVVAGCMRGSTARAARGNAGGDRGDADRRASRRVQTERPRERRTLTRRPELLPHFPDLRRSGVGREYLVGSDAEASQWKYVPVRQLALYIEESLYRGPKWAVFEPNDEPLWAQLRLNIGAFMHNLFQQGAFQGSSPSTAYLVKCDKDTTTQNDIDAGVVNILVGFAPLKPAEFVVIKIQQLAGQLQT